MSNLINPVKTIEDCDINLKIYKTKLKSLEMLEKTPNYYGQREDVLFNIGYFTGIKETLIKF